MVPAVATKLEQPHSSAAAAHFWATLGIAGAAVALAQPPSSGVVLCMPDPATAADGAEMPLYVVSDTTRKKYSRYPPWCRLNVDQVPLPFVNDMEQTYEVRGTRRVVINQLVP